MIVYIHNIQCVHRAEENIYVCVRMRMRYVNENETSYANISNLHELEIY